MKTHTFFISGMHCKACIALTESELSDLKEVSSVKASLDENTVTITGEFGDRSLGDIAESLTRVLKPHGYTLTLDKPVQKIIWSDFTTALPAALAFIALFILLQKLGVLHFVNSSEMGYGTAFLIGIVASVSTCMAVVGGLVLSMSATFAKEGNRIRPQILFHGGRLVSFFFLGGAIGALGSAFSLSSTATFVLGLIVAVILLVLGVNLLDIFPGIRKLQPSLPASLGKRIGNLKMLRSTLTPLLVGVATFFLPCGFTQSMQLYSLTSGSFWTGALTMLFFALGTLPVLAVLSFSSSTLKNTKYSGVFFKAVGIVVIFFGLFNLMNSLVAAGFIAPIFSL